MSGRILDLDPRALGLKPANIDWRGPRTRARRLIGQVALGVLALAVVGTSFGGGEYFGFGFLPAVGLGVLYVIVRPNRLLPEESPPGEAEPLVEMFASRREFRRKKGRLMSEADPAMVKVLKGTLAEVHDAGVIAIVDRSLFNGIVSLPQSDGLLEEEPIVHGQPRRLSADIVIPALLGIMGISAVVSNLIQGIPDALEISSSIWSGSLRWPSWRGPPGTAVGSCSSRLRALPGRAGFARRVLVARRGRSGTRCST